MDGPNAEQYGLAFSMIIAVTHRETGNGAWANGAQETDVNKSFMGLENHGFDTFL